MDRPKQTERQVRKEARKGRNPRATFSWRYVPLMLIAPTLAAFTYRDAMHGEFVFDDTPAVQDNLSLRTVGGFWNAAFGPKHSPISNRPLICLSFALNYRSGGLDTFGYHVVNLAIHLLNTCLLWAVMRRLLMTPNMGEAFDARRAAWTATAIAVVWAVHPLASEAIVYITQRTTLMMSLFLLGTFYGALRSLSRPERRMLWQSVAVVSCALAMLSKEEAVAAPILVVLFDRAFQFDSLKSCWRERRGFYAALAATWMLLITAVAAGPRNETIGYTTEPRVNPLEWLLTQAPVIVHYMRLSIFPYPLRGAYDWEVVRSPGDVFFSGCFVLGLLAAWGWSSYHRTRWGFAGSWFFLLLAPTSSVLPIISEIIAERRMYLPMLSIVVPAVLGVLWVGERLVVALLGHTKRATAWAALPLAALAYVESRASAAHAATFADEFTFWTYNYDKSEKTNTGFLTSSMLSGYAKVLLDRGQHDEAIPLLRKAVYECQPVLNDARVNLAAALVDKGPANYQEALGLYNDALRNDPNNTNGLSNFAKLILDVYQIESRQGQARENDPRMQQAYNMLQRAIALNPLNANYYNNLGSVSFHLGRVDEALDAWNKALQLNPGSMSAASNRAVVLSRLGRHNEAAQAYKALLAQEPRNLSLLLNLSETLRLMGDLSEAKKYAAQAQAVDPNHPDVQSLLQRLAAPAPTAPGVNPS